MGRGINLIDIELGYCIECGKATIVGALQIEGWKHTIRICTYCLGNIIKEITELSNKFLRKEGKNAT